MHKTLVAAIRDNGLHGRPVALHTPLASFGWLSGGPRAVVDAFVEEGCTPMSPTFTLSASAPRPHDRHVERNAEDDGSVPKVLPPQGFSPSWRVLDRDMGLVARDVLHRPDTLRGNHPLYSFAAVGAHAAHLVGRQTMADPFAPLEALVELDAWVLAAGCGLDQVPLLHLVDHRTSVRPFRRWAMTDDAVVHECAAFGCPRSFGDFDRAVAPFEVRAQVGTSSWRMWPAAALVDAAVAARRADPSLGRCRDACPRCRDAALGGPLA